MEYEIDEFAFENWIIEDREALRPNRAPRWWRDGTGGEHSSAWDGEAGRNRLELT